MSKRRNKTIALMPMHGRHSTVARVVPYYNELGIHVIIVCSESDNAFLAQFPNVTIITTPNHFPHKINAGIAHALSLKNWNRLLMIGSDDWISPQLISDFEIEFQNGFDLVSISNCYFFDLETQSAFIWPGYPTWSHRYGEPAGAWRMYNHTLIEAIGSNMYDCEERAMDMHAWSLAKERGKVKSLDKFDYIHAIDIKDKDSMTQVYAFNYLQTVDRETEEAIKNIVNKYAAANTLTDSTLTDSTLCATREGGVNL